MLSEPTKERNAMMKVFVFVFFVPVALFGQIKGDSLLATERSIDRPITLHKGQFRITGAYSLAVITKRFDDSGDAINLRDDGLASVRHRIGLDIKYGLNEFVQLSTFFHRSGQTIRDQNTVIIPNDTDRDAIVNQNQLYEYKGWEDISVNLDMRAPFHTKKIDVGATFGISIPTAAHDPDMPSHSIAYVVENDVPQYDVDYRYNNNLGKGVAVAQVGGMVKYRLSKWAFSARVDYRHGMEEGRSYEWTHQLVDYEEFDYRQEFFTYRLPDTFEYYGEIEYQPLPFFDIILNVSGYRSQDGWKTFGQDKIAIPDATLVTINPGVELIVTPRLWFRQKFQLPVSGKSYESAYTFYTSLIYNFFLF